RHLCRYRWHGGKGDTWRQWSALSRRQRSIPSEHHAPRRGRSEPLGEATRWAHSSAKFEGIRSGTFSPLLRSLCRANTFAPARTREPTGARTHRDRTNFLGRTDHLLVGDHFVTS